MENMSNMQCALCSSALSDKNFLSFSCDHKICRKCTSYVLLSALRLTDASLPLPSQTTLPCIVCPHGSGSLSFTDELLCPLPDKSSPPEPRKDLACEACLEMASESFCQDCNKVLCSNCLENIHRHYKKSHNVCGVDEYARLKGKEQLSFLCNCKLKEEITLFCETDNLCICKYCSKFEHEGHSVHPIPSIIEQSGQELKEMQDSLEICQNNIMKSISVITKDFDVAWTGDLKEIINLSQNLIDSFKSQIYQEEATLKRQFDVLNVALQQVCAEEASKIGLHPNKIVQINRFTLQNQKKCKEHRIEKRKKDLELIHNMRLELEKILQRMQKNERMFFWKIMDKSAESKSTEINEGQKRKLEKKPKGESKSPDYVAGQKRKLEKKEEFKTQKKVKTDVPKNEQTQQDKTVEIPNTSDCKLEYQGEESDEILKRAYKFLNPEHEAQKDPKKAFECFKRAAEMGNAEAWDQLGLCYELGHSGKKDESEAFKCYVKATELGNFRGFYLNFSKESMKY